jgi:hypothetical protein
MKGIIYRYKSKSELFLLIPDDMSYYPESVVLFHSMEGIEVSQIYFWRKFWRKKEGKILNNYYHFTRFLVLLKVKREEEEKVG